MDVRCERCGREYVFDDDKVTEAGIIVRCTRCSHTFRLRRTALITSEPVGDDELPLHAPTLQRGSPVRASEAEFAGGSARNWLIRQQNGNVIAFQELATLQQWIAAGKVTRDDEISRSGSLWRKLGAVPEFEGLFEPLAVAADPALPFQSTAAFDAPTPPPGHQPAARPTDIYSLSSSSSAKLRGAAAASSRTLQDGQYQLGDVPGGAKSPPAWASDGGPDVRQRALREPASESASWGRPPPPPQHQDRSASSSRDAANRSAAMSKSGVEGDGRRLSVSAFDDDELPMAGWQRRRRRRIVIFSTLAMLGLAVLALYLFQRPLLLRMFGQEPPSAPAGPSDGTAGVTPTTLSVPAPTAPTYAPATPGATAVATGPIAGDAGVEASAVASGRPAANASAAPSASASVISPESAKSVKSKQPIKPVKQPKPAKSAKEARSGDGDLPRNVKALVAQANRLRERNPRKAIELYDRALQEGPSAAAHAGKAWAYLETGDQSLAVREFIVAIRMGKRGDSYIGLGTAYRKLGQRDNARKQFQRYLELYPGGEEAPVARTNLDSLN